MWEPAGRYWAGRESTGEMEWDVVSVSSDRQHIFLGECKWMHEGARAKVDEASRAVKNCLLPPLPAKVRVHLGLFLPSTGKRTKIDNVFLFDAEKVLET
jgi:hypothetical protein